MGFIMTHTCVNKGNYSRKSSSDLPCSSIAFLITAGVRPWPVQVLFSPFSSMYLYLAGRAARLALPADLVAAIVCSNTVSNQHFTVLLQFTGAFFNFSSRLRIFFATFVNNNF